MATQAEVAEHLFLTDRSIRDLISRGVLPAARRGQLDMDDCRRRYLDHLRMIAAGRARGSASGDDDLDLAAEKARLTKEQADAAAMKNARDRRELLPRTAVNEAVVDAFGRVRDRLLGLPGRLVATLANRTGSDVRRVLTGAIDEALLELSLSATMARIDHDAAA
ncbi:MAG: hypothetical protein GC191_11475 [Azospirillum sp.]|nr:hypothetical protein [Azospirillum sp.]